MSNGKNTKWLLKWRATYADDTAIIASNDCQILASRDVQDELDLLQDWFQKWNIKINSDKSTQVTFTLRKHDCLDKN